MSEVPVIEVVLCESFAVVDRQMRELLRSDEGWKTYYDSRTEMRRNVAGVLESRIFVTPFDYARRLVGVRFRSYSVVGSADEYGSVERWLSDHLID